MNRPLSVALGLTIGVLMAESVLCAIGYSPGVYSPPRDFRKVDELRVFPNFITDETGIYRFGPHVTDSMRKWLSPFAHSDVRSRGSQAYVAIDQEEKVYRDFLNITAPESRIGSLLTWLMDRMEGGHGPSLLAERVRNGPPFAEDTLLARLIGQYVERPFNSEGFRSIPFENDTTDGRGVLLIGDSFVYGLRARPFHASFYDNLLAMGHRVYAAGIPGTNPAQYAAIAAKYVPILRPGLVIMCFYEGNDYMAHPWIPRAGEPHEHLTNAGFFQSAPYGKYLSPKDAYDYYLTLSSVPPSESTFNELMARTRISTLLWEQLMNLGVVNNNAADSSLALIPAREEEEVLSFTADALSDFDSICGIHGVSAIYVLIPDHGNSVSQGKDNVRSDLEKASRAFRGLRIHSPANLLRSLDYAKGDSHLNTSGSLKFSLYLDSIITSVNHLRE
jgi:hypothetical protein